MTPMADLQSDRALVLHREHRCEQGRGTVWFVCLADGYLIDCGTDRVSEARARLLASIINDAEPKRFNRPDLAGEQP